MSDYERCVEQAVAIYGDTIRDYVVENSQLRGLVRDMWRDGMCECDKRGACVECEYGFPDRMRKLGIEVNR